MKSIIWKIVAIVIWVASVPAGYVLGLRPEVTNYFVAGAIRIQTQYVWSWEQGVGFGILFLILGLIVFQLSTIIKNQEKSK